MAPVHDTPVDDNILDHLQSFVSENKRALLVGAAAAAVAVGAIYYASSSSTSKPAGSSKKESKKRRKEGKDGKRVGDADGPILEELKPPSITDQEAPLSEVQIAALTKEERAQAASEYKAKGNGAYQARDFAKAIEFYTRAINVTPTPDAVYYSNRAACYVNVVPPQTEKVIADCDAALAIDRNYIKALNRRAVALENLERYEEALRDFTAATILEKFQNDQAGQSVERVLKKLSGKKATAMMADRPRRLPSFTFVSAYFSAFRSRSLPVLPDPSSTGDSTLILALEALSASDYAHAVTLANEAVLQGPSSDILKAEALNLRGTFRFLMGDTDAGAADLQEAVRLHPANTQAWVKLASVHMEQGDPGKAFECFDSAIAQNEDDPDIYYHRGQVLFIMNEFTQAAENYEKSSKLDDNFVFSHIQLAVAQYKMGNLANSMASFRRTMKAFPDRSEPQNYYGELLLDQGRFQDAVEKFDRAIELERLKTPMNVLPLVNKGLALFQWKQDIEAAERCCREALSIDDAAEAAVATLAQLSLQQGKIDEAVKMFERNAELARNETELANALTYQYASYAQLEFMKNYPEQASMLSQMAAAGGMA